MRHGVRVRLDLLEKAGILQHLDDALARLLAGQPVQVQRRRARLAVVGDLGEEGLVALQREPRLGVEDVDQAERLPATDLEVVEVVRRRDLHRARPLFRVGIGVGDDRDQPPDQRQAHVPADEMVV